MTTARLGFVGAPGRGDGLGGVIKWLSGGDRGSPLAPCQRPHSFSSPSTPSAPPTACTVCLPLHKPALRRQAAAVPAPPPPPPSEPHLPSEDQPQPQPQGALPQAAPAYKPMRRVGRLPRVESLPVDPLGNYKYLFSLACLLLAVAFCNLNQPRSAGSCLLYMVLVVLL